MSDEECDYMSDAFLAKITPTEDVRPGLKRSYASVREHEVEKKRQRLLEEQRANRKDKKTIKEIESEKREEGLQTSIDSSNKGFALLAKMGYKPGTSLGKEGTGRTEPVPINIKEGRGGLGRETAIQLIKEKKQRIQEKRAAQIVAEFDPAAFRAQMREKHMSRRLEIDLAKAKKSCRELDQQNDYLEPVESWFWPTPDKQKLLKDDDAEDYEDDEEEEEEILYTTDEQLDILLQYIRTAHFYCLYCGTSYSDVEDMREHCPGPSREDHEDHDDL